MHISSSRHAKFMFSLVSLIHNNCCSSTLASVGGERGPWKIHFVFKGPFVIEIHVMVKQSQPNKKALRKAATWTHQSFDYRLSGCTFREWVPTISFKRDSCPKRRTPKIRKAEYKAVVSKGLGHPSSGKRAGIIPPEPNIGQLYKHMQRYRAGRLGMTSSYSCIKLRASARSCTWKGRGPGHGIATRWLVGGIGLSGSQLVAGAGRARRQWPAQGAGKQAGRAQSTARRRRTARAFSRCKVKDMACPRRSVSIAASSPLRAARALPRTANTFWAVGPHPPPEP